MQDGRNIALSLMDSLLSGHLSVSDFCPRYEKLFNFEWPDRAQDIDIEQFQALFDAVAWYSPFPEERDRVPHYKGRGRYHRHRQARKVACRMISAQVPISLCHANCVGCGLPTEFRFFESGPGGDFATYVGVKTGNLYRLDLAKAHYTRKSVPDILAPVYRLEGGAQDLLRIPDQLQCKICGGILSTSRIAADGEELVSAFLV